MGKYFPLKYQHFISSKHEKWSSYKVNKKSLTKTTFYPSLIRSFAKVDGQ